MNRPEVPCRCCEDRTPTCHAECDRYKEYTEKQAEYREKIKKERNGYRMSPRGDWGKHRRDDFHRYKLKGRG